MTNIHSMYLYKTFSFPFLSSVLCLCGYDEGEKQKFDAMTSVNRVKDKPQEPCSFPTRAESPKEEVASSGSFNADFQTPYEA